MSYPNQCQGDRGGTLDELMNIKLSRLLIEKSTSNKSSLTHHAIHILMNSTVDPSKYTFYLNKTNR